MNESSKANDQGAQQNPPHLPTPPPLPTEAAHDPGAESPAAEGAPPKQVAAEPEATGPIIAGADYEFAEPKLGSAEISEDVANSVDLSAAEAEAASVEHEAQLAAQAVAPSSSLTAPRVHSTPAEEAANSGVGTDATTATNTAAGDAEGDAGGDAEGDSSVPVLRTDLSTPPVVSNSWTQTASQTPEQPPIPEQAAPEQPPIPKQAAPTAPLVGPGVDAGHGWRRPETPWQQSQTPWQPKGASWQSPDQIARAAAASHAGADPTPQPPHVGGNAGIPPVPPLPGGYPGGQQGPTGSQGPGSQGPGAPQGPQGPGYPATPQGPGDGSNGSKKLFIILGGVIVGVGLIVLFVWLLVGLVTNNLDKDSAAPAVTEPSHLMSSKATESQVDSSEDATTEESAAADESTPGVASDADIIEASLSPLEWLEGDCFRDFKNASTPADVVVCSTPHNAQLVGAFYYDQDDQFPGADALQAKAREVCDGVTFTSEASGKSTLKQTPAYPSESTWNDNDDRRVDCLVYDTRDGNPLEATLTK